MKILRSTLIFAAMAAGLALAAWATDISGQWTATFNTQVGEQHYTYTFKVDGDKLTGTMSWPDQKDTNLKDLKMKDGELTFSAERVLGDNKFNIEYKFMVNGDALRGKGTLDIGGEKRDFDIEGKREK